MPERHRLRGRLVYLTSCILDPFELFRICWLVVAAQRYNFATAAQRHHRPTVSHIGHIADVADDQEDDSTRTRPLHQVHVTSCHIPLLTELQKLALRFLEALSDGCLGVPRERFLSHYVMVQIIAQKLGARTSAMAIVHPEVGAGGPQL